MEPEGGAQVGGFGGGDRGRLGHQGVPFVVVERVGGCGKPPLVPTTGAKSRAKTIWAAVRGAPSSSSGAGAGGTARRETALRGQIDGRQSDEFFVVDHRQRASAPESR